MLTKTILSEIKPSEIFRVVTTRVQAVHDIMHTTLKFVCVKGKADGEDPDGLAQDWAIYAGRPEQDDIDIARYGDKVHGFTTIQSICPCDESAYELYRR